MSYTLVTTAVNSTRTFETLREACLDFEGSFPEDYVWRYAHLGPAAAELDGNTVVFTRNLEEGEYLPEDGASSVTGDWTITHRVTPN